jgi:hypothetical protein
MGIAYSAKESSSSGWPIGYLTGWPRGWTFPGPPWPPGFTSSLLSSSTEIDLYGDLDEGENEDLNLKGMLAFDLNTGTIYFFRTWFTTEPITWYLDLMSVKYDGSDLTLISNISDPEIPSPGSCMMSHYDSDEDKLYFCGRYTANGGNHSVYRMNVDGTEIEYCDVKYDGVGGEDICNPNTVLYHSSSGKFYGTTQNPDRAIIKFTWETNGDATSVYHYTDWRNYLITPHIEGVVLLGRVSYIDDDGNVYFTGNRWTIEVEDELGMGKIFLAKMTPFGSLSYYKDITNLENIYYPFLSFYSLFDEKFYSMCSKGRFNEDYGKYFAGIDSVVKFDLSDGFIDAVDYDNTQGTNSISSASFFDELFGFMYFLTRDKYPSTTWYLNKIHYSQVES